MRTYTLKEVSKKINVSPGIIRQWEKDLEGLLVIPRTKQGARFYSKNEINQLIDIQQLYASHLGKEAVREAYEKKLLAANESEGEESSEDAPLPVPDGEESSEASLPVSEDNLTTVLPKEVPPNTEDFFVAMDVYKKTFLNEVKNEIRNTVRTEVVEEVKKEISKGTYYTVKSISDSIYKSNENTKAELQELTDSIERSTEVTVEKYKSLEETMTSQSFETAEEIFTLSKQLSETSEELSHYIDVTNNEIQGLTETLEKDREYYAEEREQFRQEIRQREIAFQSMLSSFRDAAGAKEKKWWKFW